MRHKLNRFAKRRIGLLGGSFNPAHAGHVHISLQAIKHLGLDEVWWLVSPKNPLKQAGALADSHTRLHHAQIIAAPHPNIRVRDDEMAQHIYYTSDSISYFKKHYPYTRFVWLMGADNLAQFHRWRDWQMLAHRIPIAVLDRAPYNFTALAQKMALRFKNKRIPATKSHMLCAGNAPKWVYLTIPRHKLSATLLRKTLGQNAFFRHNK